MNASRKVLNEFLRLTKDWYKLERFYAFNNMSYYGELLSAFIFAILDKCRSLNHNDLVNRIRQITTNLIVLRTQSVIKIVPPEQILV